MIRAVQEMVSPKVLLTDNGVTYAHKVREKEMGRLLSMNQSESCSVLRNLLHCHIPALQIFHNGRLGRCNLYCIVKKNGFRSIFVVLTETSNSNRYPNTDS